MAKIVPSDQAPNESVHYSFAEVEFDLGGKKKTFETDDPRVVANASAHPWLKVEGGVSQAPAAEDASAEEDVQPVAIESGKDQTKAIETAGVAETLAADENSKTKDKS